MKLRQNLVDEVRGNVALTDRAKIEMKQKYEKMLEHGRIQLFYRYKVRFACACISASDCMSRCRQQKVFRTGAHVINLGSKINWLPQNARVYGTMLWNARLVKR